MAKRKISTVEEESPYVFTRVVATASSGPGQRHRVLTIGVRKVKEGNGELGISPEFEIDFNIVGKVVSFKLDPKSLNMVLIRDTGLHFSWDSENIPDFKGVTGMSDTGLLYATVRHIGSNATKFTLMRNCNSLDSRIAHTAHHLRDAREVMPEDQFQVLVRFTALLGKDITAIVSEASTKPEKEKPMQKENPKKTPSSASTEQKAEPSDVKEPSPLKTSPAYVFYQPVAIAFSSNSGNDYQVHVGVRCVKEEDTVAGKAAEFEVDVIVKHLVLSFKIDDAGDGLGVARMPNGLHLYPEGPAGQHIAIAGMTKSGTIVETAVKYDQAAEFLSLRRLPKKIGRPSFTERPFEQANKVLKPEQLQTLHRFISAFPNLITAIVLEGDAAEPVAPVQKAEVPVTTASPPITFFQKDKNGVITQLVRKGYCYRERFNTPVNYVVLRGLSSNNFSVHILNPKDDNLTASLFIGTLSIMLSCAVFDSAPLNVVSKISISFKDITDEKTSLVVTNRTRDEDRIFAEATRHVKALSHGTDKEPEYLEEWAEFFTVGLETIFDFCPNLDYVQKTGFASIRGFFASELPLKKQAPPPQPDPVKNALANFMHRATPLSQEAQLTAVMKGQADRAPGSGKNPGFTQPPKETSMDISSMTKSDLQTMMYKVDNALRMKRIEAVRRAISRTFDRVVRAEYDRMLQEIQKGRNVFVDDCLDRLELRLSIDD